MIQKIDKLRYLQIGVQGENIANDIQIDVSEWVEAYPGASIHLLFKPYNAVAPSPMTITVEDGILTWQPSLGATVVIGVGYTEVRAIDPETGMIKKSRIIPTAVENSVSGVDSENPPEPFSDWVNNVLAAGAAAAAAAHGKMVKFEIDAETGHLMLLSTNDETESDDTEWTSADLGPVDAYAIAVLKGYQGTSEQFAQYMADIANGAASAAASAAEAAQYTSTAVHEWLDDHIDPDSGYALDRTLTEPLEAAPADLVGSLKSTLGVTNGELINILDDKSGNLFWIFPEQKTINGVTYSFDSETGMLTFNGTATENTFIPIRGLQKGLGAAGTYYGVLANGSDDGTISAANNFSLRYGDFSNGIGTRWLNDGNRSVSVTLTDADNVALYFLKNTVFTNKKYLLRINSSDTNTFEVGGFTANDAIARKLIDEKTLSIKRALKAEDDIDGFSEVGVFTKPASVSPTHWPQEYVSYYGIFVNTISTGAGIQIIVTSLSLNNAKTATILYRLKSGGAFTPWQIGFASKYVMSASDDVNTITDNGIYFTAKSTKPLNWNMFQADTGSAGTLINLINYISKVNGVQIAISENGEIAYRQKTTVSETNPAGWENWITVRNELDSLRHYARQYGTALLENARPVIMEHNYSNRCINFSFITDTHYGGTRLENYESRHNLMLFSDFSNEKFLDFAVHGGDFITDYDTDQDEAINIMDDSLEIMGNIRIPTFNCVGNHERNWSYVLEVNAPNLDWENTEYYVYDNEQEQFVRVLNEQQWIDHGGTDLYISTNDGNSSYEIVVNTSNIDWENTKYYAWDTGHVQLVRVNGNEQWIERHCPDLYTSTTVECLSPIQIALMLQNNISDKVVDPENPMGGYFYRDFPELKIRCIFVNSYPLTYDDDDETVVDTGTYPQALWMANTALRFDNVSEWKVIIFAHDRAPSNIKNVLIAFKNGTKRKISESHDAYADFKSQGEGTLIAWFHGHKHSDTYLYQDGICYIGVTAGFVQKQTLTLNPDKAFCFSVFSIDTANEIIYETRIGKWNPSERTVDRSWNYGTGEQLS